MPQQPGLLTDPMGFFREMAERNAARAPVDDLGQRNPGLLNDTLGFITGATDEGTQEYIRAGKSQKAKNKYFDEFERRGLEWDDDKTGAQAAQEIREFDEKEKRDDVIETQELIHNSPGNRRDRMVEDRRYYDNQKQLAQQRLDSLAAIERSERREDRRYNERMELESKRDRRQAMQSLAAGLASLGAAFAL